MFGKTPSTPTRSAPASTPSSALTTATGHDYTCAWSDDDVARAGYAEGAQGIGSPDYGAADPHMVAVLTRTARTAVSVITHHARAAIGANHDVYSRAASAHPGAVVDAKAKADQAYLARLNLLSLETLMRRLHLAPSTWKNALIHFLILLALFAGDLGVVAPAYQVLGLADTPWIASFALLDDLHAAALATVVAMVVLGELAGRHLKDTHTVLNSKDTDRGEDSRLAKPSKTTNWVAIAAAAAILVLVVGVAQIRVDYLSRTGASVATFAFVAIQIGVLLAAAAAAYHKHNPLEHDYRARKNAAQTADTEDAAALAHVEDLTATANNAVTAQDTLSAQALQHAQATLRNAAMQTPMYLRAHRLALTEPPTGALWEGWAEDSSLLGSKKLRKALIALHQLPALPRLDHRDLTQHREQLRAKLATWSTQAANAEAAHWITPPVDQSSNGRDSTDQQDDHVSEAPSSGPEGVPGAPATLKSAS